jgi:hypothetical protein
MELICVIFGSKYGARLFPSEATGVFECVLSSTQH